MLGEKLEAFYLALSNSSEDLFPLIDAVEQLEQHKPNNNYGETPEVVDEIAKDCRKKCAKLIRIPYAESVNSLITSCRKKLNAKAALGTDSSLQHSQRHVNALIELLGTWSNIVAKIYDYELSPILFKQTVSPLYSRVVDTAWECFHVFRTDKELEQWGAKLLDPATQFNLNTLDFLITQISTMREIINQYYTFLYNRFASYSGTSDTGTSSINSSNSSDETSRQSQNSTSYIDKMVIVTNEEMLKWREIEALYVTLEFGYVSRAVIEAFSEVGLLEIENDVYVPQAVEDLFFLLNRIMERAISTGQESCIFAVGNKLMEVINCETHADDMVLLYYVCSRKSVYRYCYAKKAINNKAIDSYLNPTKKVAKAPSLPPSANKTDASNNPNQLFTPVKAAVPSSAPKNGLGSRPPSGVPKPSGLNKANSDSTSDFFSGNTVGIAASSMFADVASASLTGVNDWLIGLASPYIEVDSTVSTPTLEGKNTDSKSRVELFKTPNHSSQQSSKLTPPNSLRSNSSHTSGAIDTPTIDQLIFSALEVDNDIENDDDYDMKYGHTYVDSFSYDNYNYLGFSTTNTIPPMPIKQRSMTLKEENWVVQLNAVATAVASIEKLSKVVKRGVKSLLVYKDSPDSISSNNSAQNDKIIRAVSSSNSLSQKDVIDTKSSTINVLLKEFLRCEKGYRLLLSDECQQYAALIFNQVLLKDFSDFRSKSFDISGQDMEDHYNDNILLGLVKKNFAGGSKAFFDPNTIAISKLSLNAYCAVLAELGTIIARVLMEELILKTNFNEWGALLLHQEVQSMTAAFDSLIEDIDLSIRIKSPFDSLQLALKVLTLDQPADIRQYAIKASLISEEKVRKILSRRVDFQKDAVTRVKINII